MAEERSAVLETEANLNKDMNAFVMPREDGKLSDAERAQIQEADSSAKAMQDFTSPQELYGELVAGIRKYHPSDDISIIDKAYRIAYEAHKDQKRKSGEPYIIHPLCVAIILADLELDKETIVAGLLHDVVEDTIMTEEEIQREFGPEVALLVDGVTKLGRLNYSTDKLDTQAENLRKMFLAMAKDIRVIMIKLADRLHNMRTLQYMRPEKQKEKARETREIYAPIAQRLGISKIKVELDDLSLKYLEPEVYYDLVEKVSLKKGERQSFINEIVRNVEVHITKAGIHAEIYGRAKHLFSIYKKMVNQGKTIDQIYDLFAVRIIVDTVRDCYGALGVIHEMYKPVPGRFKDYIAMPKQKMYQSLHTTLIGPGGTPFEIQIRTVDMHRVAEYGIAAHWKYKETSDGKKVTSERQEEEKLIWLRQILEWQQESDNKEFLSLLKSDLNLFNDSVYCFTPSGDVKTLPNGSTPIDFAYSIHSAVGNTMVGARVNGKLVTIDYQIQNGDRIEIITSQNSKGPSADWLKIVRSTQAKNKINQWFKHERKEDNIIRGKELLASFCKTKGLNLSELLKPEYTETVTKKYGFKDWESVLAAIGHGGLKEGQIVNRLQECYDKDHIRALTDEDILAHSAKGERPKVTRSKTGIIVRGIDGVSVRLSKCCSPVPGDEIVGFITRGRGVTVHRKDCVNVTGLTEEEQARLIDVEWSTAALKDDGRNGKLYLAEIRIFAHNRTGLLVDITKIFTERHIDVRSVASRMSKSGTVTISYEFEVPGKDALADLIGKIRQVESVIDVRRTTG